MAGHAGLANGAGTGVNAFFVLSGFLITHLLLKEYERRGSISIGAFYARRALRIFPAYYVFLLFSLSVDAYQGDARSREVALPAALYYLNYYHAVNGHSSASIAHAWSLAVEEQFYLIWPLCLILGLTRGRRAVAYGLIAAIAAVCLWRSVGILSLGLAHSWAYNALDCRFDSLAAGCLLAILIHSESFANKASFVDASAFAPLVTVLALSLPHIFPNTTWRFTVGPTVEALLVAVLIMQLLVLARSGFWSWLEWRPVRYLGAISYSSYLYHQWGLALGDDIARFIGGAQFLLGVGVTALLASGSYWVIEKPFLALKTRLGREPVAARA
jgi:peptidoglycan/LPS O-acetylase OafA/YrhL